MPRDAAEGQKPHNMLCLRQLHKLKIILKQINLFVLSLIYIIFARILLKIEIHKNSYIQ